jgi:hypothetical protein
MKVVAGGFWGGARLSAPDRRSPERKIVARDARRPGPGSNRQVEGGRGAEAMMASHSRGLNGGRMRGRSVKRFKVFFASRYLGFDADGERRGSLFPLPRARSKCHGETGEEGLGALPLGAQGIATGARQLLKYLVQFLKEANSQPGTLVLYHREASAMSSSASGRTVRLRFMSRTTRDPTFARDLRGLPPRADPG